MTRKLVFAMLALLSVGGCVIVPAGSHHHRVYENASWAERQGWHHDHDGHYH